MITAALREESRWSFVVPIFLVVVDVGIGIHCVDIHQFGLHKVDRICQNHSRQFTFVRKILSPSAFQYIFN